eukprot:Rhum_TRINITY_DN8520_c0_g1::Rhum_TRINITY_DN8520_c0_g1_i1::g.28481::m.28481
MSLSLLLLLLLLFAVRRERKDYPLSFFSSHRQVLHTEHPLRRAQHQRRRRPRRVHKTHRHRRAGQDRAERACLPDVPPVPRRRRRLRRSSRRHPRRRRQRQKLARSRLVACTHLVEVGAHACAPQLVLADKLHLALGVRVQVRHRPPLVPRVVRALSPPRHRTHRTRRPPRLVLRRLQRTRHAPQHARPRVRVRTVSGRRPRLLEHAVKVGRRRAHIQHLCRRHPRCTRRSLRLRLRRGVVVRRRQEKAVVHGRDVAVAVAVRRRHVPLGAVHGNGRAEEAVRLSGRRLGRRRGGSRRGRAAGTGGGSGRVVVVAVAVVAVVDLRKLVRLTRHRHRRAALLRRHLRHLRAQVPHRASRRHLRVVPKPDLVDVPRPVALVQHRRCPLRPGQPLGEHRPLQRIDLGTLSLRRREGGDR